MKHIDKIKGILRGPGNSSEVVWNNMLVARMLSALEENDPAQFPSILLVEMRLKEKQHPGADSIIKKAIIKMAKAPRMWDKVYKEEIDFIIDKEFPSNEDDSQAAGHPLLKNAVKEVCKITYEYHRNILHLSALELRIPMIKLLCVGGADINRLDDRGLCALKIAMYVHPVDLDTKIETIKTLFSYNSNNIYIHTKWSEFVAAAVSYPDLWPLFIEYNNKCHVQPGTREITSNMSKCAEIAIDGDPNSGYEIYKFYQDTGHDVSVFGMDCWYSPSFIIPH